MLIRFFPLLLLLTLLDAKEYPHSYAQLGSPLFSALKPFAKMQDIQLLHDDIVLFEQHADTVLQKGYKVDASEKKSEKKEYLKELRKLQKEYDKLLHKLHQAISTSINENDYKSFTRLTAYPFEGLFKHRGLKNRAIKFYEKHKNTSQCKVIDDAINDTKLLAATDKYFEEVVAENSSYNPNSKVKSKKKVSIETQRVKNRISVDLVNKNPYPVTIKVNPYYENIAPSQGTKNELVLEANSKRHYTDLDIRRGTSYYRYSFFWIMGSKNAQHDDAYIYRLPYKVGTSHKVSQGYNGKYTHKGRSAYSIDFPMPVGTKIYAAREGVVVKTKSNSNVGGYDKKFSSSGNYVRVLHSDGTLATYYHLKYRGVLVHVGQTIFKGTPLGYSGNTGYTSGPHLHFAVFQAISARKTQTIPLKILTEKGIIIEPKQGTFYKAR